MGILDIFRRPATLHIADCLSRKVTRVKVYPASLGGRSNNGQAESVCRITRSGGRYHISPQKPDCVPILDGRPIEVETELEPDLEYSLQLQGHLLAIVISKAEPEFLSGFEVGDWIVSKKSAPSERHRVRLDQLDRGILSRTFSPISNFSVAPDESNASFDLASLFEALPQGQPNPIAPPERIVNFGTDSAALISKAGVHTCPNCWKSFSPGDIMNIAAHEDLRGDPQLGSHSKLRFKAERFNDVGQALDPKGVVSVELACPHCRGRLPPSFLSQDQLILSLVGAPSSGKSYYLSVLLQQLPEELIRYFRVTLQDGDPSGNVHLNEMKNRLFSATSREDAFISKTDFEGLMYEQLMRNGRQVPLPRPFVYQLRQMENPDQRTSLVFYDNAGEHFKPTVSLDDSPGALHVAASSALFYLFDPTTNRAFRHALNRKRDAQLRSQATDEQDTILAEMGIRIKKLRAIECHEKIDTPLAVMVGKFDIWKSLMPEAAIHIPADRPISLEEIHYNSETTRKLLLEMCPTIVANAESISTNVSYFPLSSLGHSPKPIEEGPLEGKLAPMPRRLKPILATAPTLWAISQVAPEAMTLPDSAGIPV